MLWKMLRHIKLNRYKRQITVINRYFCGILSCCLCVLLSCLRSVWILHFIAQWAHNCSLPLSFEEWTKERSYFLRYVHTEHSIVGPFAKRTLAVLVTNSSKVAFSWRINVLHESIWNRTADLADWCNYLFFCPGQNISCGVIIHGISGTGKTYLARAMINVTKLPVVHVCVSITLIISVSRCSGICLSDRTSLHYNWLHMWWLK